MDEVINVKISQAHVRLIRIIMTVLSLASSVDLMCILNRMIARNKEIAGPTKAYISMVIPIVIYIILFICLAASYWTKKIPRMHDIRNTIIIIALGMTISSYLIAWPAFIFTHSTVITMVNESLLAGTTIIALMTNNLDSFTSSSMVLLLFLKFITATISLFYGAFILVSLTAGGNTILGTSVKIQNLLVILSFVFTFWNVAYAVIIWLGIYRRWWAWVLTILFILEVSVPLIWETAIFSNGSVWSGLIISSLIAVITVIMTYLNNFLSKIYQKMD